MDVAKADRDVAHVASVSKACCKSLLKMFHMFKIYVASVLSGSCICYHGYIASACSKCFSYFNRMFQLFHLSVANLISMQRS
jgi:hypothetical protein